MSTQAELTQLCLNAAGPVTICVDGVSHLAWYRSDSEGVVFAPGDTADSSGNQLGYYVTDHTGLIVDISAATEVTVGPCDTALDTETQVFCDDTLSDGTAVVKFLRRFTFDAEGEVINTVDLDLSGAAYTPLGDVVCCEEGAVEFEESIVCADIAGEDTCVIRRVERDGATGVYTETFIGNDGAVIDPAPTTWAPGKCGSECVGTSSQVVV